MNEPPNSITDAIAFFERILQSMPDDRVSLEFLGGAYEQIGDADKAHATWFRLATCVLRAGDVEQAGSIRPRLDAYADDPAVATLISRLDALLRADRDKARAEANRPPTVAAVKPMPTVAGPAQLRMATAFAEVGLAWILHERGFLDAAEYENLTSELTEGGADVPEFPVSALYGLHQLHPDKTDAAVLLLMETYHVVPLRLDAFSIPPDMRTVLPPHYVRIKGAFPFARLGSALQVAVLNPADAKLKTEVETLTGMPCTFFLAHPANLASALAAFPAP